MCVCVYIYIYIIYILYIYVYVYEPCVPGTGTNCTQPNKYKKENKKKTYEPRGPEDGHQLAPEE